MYSNIYDTVRTKRNDIIQMTNFTYYTMINGFHPTMTLTHAIDSEFILSNADKENNENAEGFLKLIENRHIQFAGWNEKTPIEHLCSQLRGGNFRFSNQYLSFLHDPDFGEDAKEAVFNYMLGKLNDEGIGHIFPTSFGQDYQIKVDQYINIVKDIEGIVNTAGDKNKFFVPNKAGNLSLSRYVDRRIGDLTHENFGRDELKKELNKFMKTIKRRELVGKRCLSRSDMYKILEGGHFRDCDSIKTEIVDFAYHEQIASGIVDGERDIFTQEKGNKLEDRVRRFNLKKSYKTFDLANIEIPRKILAKKNCLDWDILNSTLECAKGIKNGNKEISTAQSISEALTKGNIDFHLNDDGDICGIMAEIVVGAGAVTTWILTNYIIPDSDFLKSLATIFNGLGAYTDFHLALMRGIEKIDMCTIKKEFRKFQDENLSKKFSDEKTELAIICDQKHTKSYVILPDVNKG